MSQQVTTRSRGRRRARTGKALRNSQLHDRFRIRRDRAATPDKRFVLEVNKTFDAPSRPDDWQVMGRADRKKPLLKLAKYATNPRITKPIRTAEQFKPSN